MVNRVIAAGLQLLETDGLRIRNQRLHIGVFDRYTDGGRYLARYQHIFEFFAFFDRHHIARRLKFGDVFIAGQNPCDLGQVNAMVVLQHPARPHASRHGVAAIDTDLPTFQVLRTVNAERRVVDNCRVMKGAHQKNR